MEREKKFTFKISGQIETNTHFIGILLVLCLTTNGLSVKRIEKKNEIPAESELRGMKQENHELN